MSARTSSRAAAGDGPAGGAGGDEPPLVAGLSFARALREAVEGGMRLPEALAGAAAELPQGARHGLERVVARARGDYAEDEWGFDPELADALQPALELLYDRWWRVHAHGLLNVPTHGRALLVANHAGVLPWDAAMIAVALMREHPLPRHARFLVLDRAFELPWLSFLLRKVGGVMASPHNAVRLLEQDHLVTVFPEGVKGTGKPYADRYRLQRFGRGGFVETALATGAPIVPVAVVGSEEIYPKVAEAPLVARVTRLPFFPVTPTFPLLGPLGLVPLPSRWRIEFCPPIETAPFGPDAARDRALVLELSEQVREIVQQRVYENLVSRGSIFI